VIDSTTPWNSAVSIFDLVNMKSALLCLVLLPVALSCIGSGCVWDKENKQFFWLSDRAESEVASVKIQGGPQSYCQSLGLEITPRGSKLWRRAHAVARQRGSSSAKKEFSPSVVCHEPKWD